MDDLDKVLLQLRTLPVPQRLAALEGDVMERIDAEQRMIALTSGSALGLAGIAALAIGMAGAVLPGVAAQATQASVFGSGSSLAPSTLLANVG